jgi:hypothetical protein
MPTYVYTKARTHTLAQTDAHIIKAPSHIQPWLIKPMHTHAHMNTHGRTHQVTANGGTRDGPVTAPSYGMINGGVCVCACVCVCLLLPKIATLFTFHWEMKVCLCSFVWVLFVSANVCFVGECVVCVCMYVSVCECVCVYFFALED